MWLAGDPKIAHLGGFQDRLLFSRAGILPGELSNRHVTIELKINQCLPNKEGQIISAITVMTRLQEFIAERCHHSNL